MPLISGKTVMAFVPHPDDEFSSSGTLAKLVKRGNRCIIAVATDGSKGTHDPEARPEQLVAIRREEMARAGEALGCEVLWLGFVDGTLQERLAELKEAVFRALRQYRPDVVIVHDGWRRWELHPDHRTLGQSVAEAAYLADGCWFFPEHIEQGLEPHRTGELYVVRTDEPNYWVDITDTFGQKIVAAAFHKSQQRGGFWRNAPAASAIQNVEERIRRMYERTGQDPYQEAFRKLRGSDLDL